jgi:ATP-binding cassette subfamily B protein
MRTLRLLPSLLRLVWQASPTLTLATILFRIVRAALPVVMIYVGKLIIDEVVTQVRLPLPNGNLWDLATSGRLDYLLGLVGIEFFLAILSDALGWSNSLVDSLLGERYSNFASMRLMHHVSTLDLEQLEDPEHQNQLERARRQVTGQMPIITQLLSQLQDIITACSLVVGLIAYEPWFIVFLIVSLLPAFVSALYFNKRDYELDYAHTSPRRHLDYVRQLGTDVESFKEVKVFNLGSFFVDRFQDLSAKIYCRNRQLAVRRAGWGGFYAMIGSTGYYLAYAMVIFRAIQGEFTIGDLTFVAGAFIRLRGLAEGLLLNFAQVSAQVMYLEDLFSFLAIQPRLPLPRSPRPFPEPFQSDIVFEGVSFRYPGSSRWAVHDLSLTIRAEETLAIVGENGAGKTTIVKLLLRLYDPTEGRILLDGYDLRGYDLVDLRDHMGVIFQDFVRFHLSARENIAVGRIEAAKDDNRIREAATQSIADQFIVRLPQGYDQVLGKRFEEGVELSGGEWQKIAVARAYMRHADIIILDEPTAALDVRSEHETFQRFRDLRRGKTALLISHRFSTVRMADRVVVLDGGKIIEDGTHEHLMEIGGRYAELFRMQASNYQ